VRYSVKRTIVRLCSPPVAHRNEIIFADGNEPFPIQAPLPSRRRRSSGSPLKGAALGDLVNLKRHKKRLERDRSARQAEANRARFGRTRSERLLEEERSRRAQALLDQHRIDKDQS